MSIISDIIETFLKDMMNENQGAIEIQRNEMALQFKCAPSQINYVITTRFSSEKGYYVESRRGGGGFIKIHRVATDRKIFLENVLVQQIGKSLNKETAVHITELLSQMELISGNQIMVIKAAVDDSTLSLIEKPIRDVLRARILKAAIVAAVIRTDEEVNDGKA